MADFYPPIDWTRHPLHAAAFSGNRTEVERLIAQGADVNELLDLAVESRNPAVECLAGAPLHVALRNCWDYADLFRGHHEVVKVLLAAGADVHLCRRWAGTPLHDAAQFGLTDIAGLLISYGADVNSKAEVLHRTPLHLAAMHDQVKMVDCLLALGAQIDADRNCCPGSGDFGYSRQYPHDDGRLFQYRGETPLQAAAWQGHGDVVQLLLERGACLDIATAIDLATQSRNLRDKRFDKIVARLKARQQMGA